MNRKLRMGMIGGGKNSFMGAVHRAASLMDGLIEFSAGALSSSKTNAIESGRQLFLPMERIYSSWEQMIEKEASLPSELKLDFISIVTPNHLHFKPALLALEKGFNVVIEKPFTFSLDEALLLKDKVLKTGLLLCLAHTYSGYSMVKEAKCIIKSGGLGKIRKVYVEYPQGWLSTFAESEDNKQALWRTDPNKSGKVGCVGDIGTHAAHLAEYVSGLNITHVCSHLNTVVHGRRLDDDAAMLLKFEQNASGVLISTQVAAGEENPLKIRVYGEKGGLEWHQHEPNSLTLKWADKSTEILRAGSNYKDRLSSFAIWNSRVPGGHPEGYLEAFANLYRNFALTLAARLQQKTPSPEMTDFPTEEDGVRGMAFIETVVKSATSNEKWTPFINY